MKVDFTSILFVNKFSKISFVTSIRNYKTKEFDVCFKPK